MIRGKKCISLSIVILTCALVALVRPGEARSSGFTLSSLSSLRSDSFIRMTPAVFPSLPYPYSPFAESFSFFPIDPLSSPLFSDPLNLLQPFDPLSIISPWPLIQMPLLTSLIPPAGVLASTAFPTSSGLPIRRAAQTGTWIGTWTSTWIAYVVLWHTGPMTLNIVVDPLVGTVAGTCILQGSKYTSFPITVSGVEANNILTASGFIGTGYDLLLDATLTSPTTMTGYYTVTGTNIPVLDEGVFNLTLF